MDLNPVQLKCIKSIYIGISLAIVLLFFILFFVLQKALAFRLECVELQICGTKLATLLNGKHFSHFIIPAGKEKSIFINENATTLENLRESGGGPIAQSGIYIYIGWEQAQHIRFIYYIKMSTNRCRGQELQRAIGSKAIGCSNYYNFAFFCSGLVRSDRLIVPATLYSYIYPSICRCVCMSVYGVCTWCSEATMLILVIRIERNEMQLPSWALCTQIIKHIYDVNVCEFFSFT